MWNDTGNTCWLKKESYVYNKQHFEHRIFGKFQV